MVRPLFFFFFKSFFYVCLPYLRILNKISDFFLKSYILIILVGCEFITIFFATRIQINVSWSGSGSGPMIRIRIRNTDERTENNNTWPSIFFLSYCPYTQCCGSGSVSWNGKMDSERIRVAKNNNKKYKNIILFLKINHFLVNIYE